MSIEVRERYWDNPIGAPEAPSGWFTTFAAGLLRVVWAICFRARIEGREHIEALAKQGRGAVVAGNHVSLADPPSMYVAVRPHILRLMGKESVFTKAGAFIANLAAMWGAFPVKRDTADRKAIKRAVMYIQNGEFVGIFPEGTRMRKAGMEPHYHAGTVLIARMAKAPIVPMGIQGTDKICPEGRKVPWFFHKIVVRIGAPIDPADFDHVDKKIRNEYIINEVMRNVFALRDNVPLDQVDKDLVGLEALAAEKGVELRNVTIDS